ncbi:cobalamin biosynthesis protein [Acetobacteraceae bacterium KSS8]|uniref:Cobalamin biosynthesis protein n=1 Tax=Endosaccharibacter trunci TaxID=2812733 RepID=A0ABT1W2K0_9PROT|nr:cobalamin biosynthesis protein [Acetobacteraceae bacterium KSS8]
MIAAGLGFRPGCAMEDIVQLVVEAAERSGHRPALLAAPWFRDGPVLRAAADRLGLPLAIVDEAALLRAQPFCPTRSDAARRAVGLASVAEACALAASGPGALLLLPRIAGANATCAMAGLSPLATPDTTRP